MRHKLCRERLAYRPLRKRPKLTVLITAIGVSLFLEYGGQFVFGADPKAFPELVVDRPLEHTGALTITTTQVAAFAVTILLLISLTLIVKRTRLGRAMRAVSNNATAAALMGVEVGRINAVTFAIGAFMAGAAGALLSIIFPISPVNGPLFLGKAFVVCVLGGLGSVPGAMVGGLVLGILESFCSYWFGPERAVTLSFGLLLVLLFVRPSGIMGRRGYE